MNEFGNQKKIKAFFIQFTLDFNSARLAHNLQQTKSAASLMQSVSLLACSLRRAKVCLLAALLLFGAALSAAKAARNWPDVCAFFDASIWRKVEWLSPRALLAVAFAFPSFEFCAPSLVRRLCRCLPPSARPANLEQPNHDAWTAESQLPKSTRIR